MRVPSGHRDGYRGVRLGLGVLRIGPLLILLALIGRAVVPVAVLLHDAQPRQRDGRDRGDRHPVHRTAAGDPDPRHRPVGRIHARARVGRRGAGLHQRRLGSGGDPGDAGDGPAGRDRERHRLRQGPAAPSIHHHAGDAEHRARPRAVVVGRPADPRHAGHRRFDRRRLASAGSRSRRSSSSAIAFLVFVLTTQDRLGPLDLRGRRQPGGRPADRHPGQQGAGLGLRPERPDGRRRRDHHRRSAQRGIADLRRARRTGLDRRGRHRRRELPRRPRQRRQRAGRGADDRRHPQRDEPARRSTRSSSSSSSASSSSSRSSRTSCAATWRIDSGSSRRRGHDRRDRRSRPRGPRGHEALRRCARARRRRPRSRIAARCSPSSATTARASRPSSSASAASTGSTPASSRWTALPTAIHSPAQARDLGIETVYQDLALFDNLGPAANFYAGRERPGRAGCPTWLRFLDRKAMAAQDRASCSTGSRSACRTCPPGRPDVGRAAAGGRGRPRGGVRLEGRDPRRADRGARPARVAPGPRPDPAAARRGITR